MRRFVNGRLRSLIVHSLQQTKQHPIRPHQHQTPPLLLSRFLSSSTSVVDVPNSMADKSPRPATVTVDNINPKVFFSSGFFVFVLKFASFLLNICWLVCDLWFTVESKVWICICYLGFDLVLKFEYFFFLFWWEICWVRDQCVGDWFTVVFMSPNVFELF